MKTNPRIIFGNLKGLKLKVPEDIRPATDRVKQTIFDILGDSVKDTIVLDLFTGSGNLAIEAISRGAKKATLVDKSITSINTAKENIKKAHIEDKVEILIKDFRDFLEKCSKKYDLIFLDPPFPLTSSIHLNNISKVLNKKGIIIFKVPDSFVGQLNIPENLKVILEKKIGINYIYFLNLK